MLTVNELALESGVPAQVVRYYLRIGLIEPVERQPHNGYRLFARRDVEKVRFIRVAKTLGFTLNEIKQILVLADRGESPCKQVRSTLAHRIKENRVKIESLLALQKRMEKARDAWESLPDRVPEGDSFCHLIESFSDEEQRPENILDGRKAS